jgi:glyoxylate reductase
MPKVLITYPLPTPHLEAFCARWDGAVVPKGTRVDEEFLVREAAGCEALVTLLNHPVTRRVLEACPRLRIVANAAVGYDNIDVAAAQERGVYATNTPGVLDKATADLTWALILACCRRVVEADRFLREGRFTGWEPDLFLGMDLDGRTLGVVGMGRIGTEVARRASAFGMRVAWHDPSADAAPPFPAEALGLEALLAASDVLTLHVPLTPATRGLLGRERLLRMKPGAVLINTSRGPVVDEGALAELLRTGRIAAAGLDVYEREPAVHPALLPLPNAVLLPHIASAGSATRRTMSDLALDNAERVLEGGVPLTNIYPLDTLIQHAKNP